MLTMAIGGLWHGANWTFLVWGLWHGIGVLVERVLRKYVRLNLPNWVRVSLVFAFVSIGWVFFRADSLGMAGRVLHQFLNVHGITQADWTHFGAVIGILICLLASEAVFLKKRVLSAHPLLQGLVAGILVALIYFASANEVEFIYWRF